MAEGTRTVSARRPDWFRLDTDLFDNPKIMRAAIDGGDQALMLWIRGLAYSTKHLTDGWVPLPLPKQWGYRQRHVDALTTHVLWIPLEITDDGGWLINDYRDYQPTRAEWEALGEKRSTAARAAARARWGQR